MGLRREDLLIRYRPLTVKPIFGKNISHHPNAVIPLDFDIIIVIFISSTGSLNWLFNFFSRVFKIIRDLEEDLKNRL